MFGWFSCAPSTHWGATERLPRSISACLLLDGATPPETEKPVVVNSESSFPPQVALFHHEDQHQVEGGCHPGGIRTQEAGQSFVVTAAASLPLLNPGIWESVALPQERSSRQAVVGTPTSSGTLKQRPPVTPACFRFFQLPPSGWLCPQPCPCKAMRTLSLFFLCLPVLLGQGQYDIGDPAYHDTPYIPYEIESQDYYDYAGNDIASQTPEEQYPYQSQQQNQEEVIPAPTPGTPEMEPTEPGPFDCQEEQYPCTRLYSVHKPCKQCLNEVCFYSLRRVYVINKEICIRTICAHEELLRADLCRDKFSRCGVMATSGLCQNMAASCARSCGGC